MTFQSTSLSRGKTSACNLIFVASSEISIHFPLTREDWKRMGNFQYFRYFNPLPSHEGRRDSQRMLYFFITFQSTSLSRGKTANIAKNPPSFLSTLHNFQLYLSYKIHFCFLTYYFFLRFSRLFWCESPSFSMCTSHSH